MKRRWFQFSLRTAIVAMVVAGVALGVYVRWPYYRAGWALDHAEGSKDYPEWPAARDAMVNDGGFRKSVNWATSYRVSKVTDEFGRAVFEIRCKGPIVGWEVLRTNMGGGWIVSKLYY